MFVFMHVCVYACSYVFMKKWMYLCCMRMCMYVCACMYVYMCMYVCVFACMSVRVHAVCSYANMYVCIYVCMCACMHVRMFACMCDSVVYMHACIYLRVSVCIHVWVCIYVCMYVCMSVCCIHACMYMRVCVHACSAWITLSRNTFVGYTNRIAHECTHTPTSTYTHIWIHTRIIMYIHEFDMLMFSMTHFYVCMRTRSGRTPLYIAVSTHHQTTVRILLECKADPQIPDHKVRMHIYSRWQTFAHTCDRKVRECMFTRLC
jgi:hypothetical protein